MISQHHADAAEAASWAAEQQRTAWDEVHYYRHRASLYEDIADLWGEIGRRRLMHFLVTLDYADKRAAERAWRNAVNVRASLRMAQQ